jgi:adenosylhomocysteine nucleosidase
MSQGNVGIGHFGAGDMNFNGGKVIGQSFGTDPSPSTKPSGGRRADVGILTVIDEEMRAVIEILESLELYRTRRINGNGPLAHEAQLQLRDGTVRLAAVQTLGRGPQPAVIAFQNLVREYQPAVVLLVGIAGGVSPTVHIGDVVFSDQIVYYDARRESPEGTHRRGQAYTVAAPVGYRLNEFFAAHGSNAAAPDGTPFQVFRGPIGSGDAVITDANSEIRRWLRDYNEKVLAVETEAAGAAQAFHDQSSQHNPALGWLTIRGISDVADAAKGHDDHALAAKHAATAMRLLLPHLLFTAVEP